MEKKLDSKNYVIGKSPKADYQIKGDKTVSGLHVMLFVNEKGEVFITENIPGKQKPESTNGTFINGKKLQKGSFHMLQGYEIVKLGNTTINWRDIVQNEGVQSEKEVDSKFFEKTKISQGSNKGLKTFFIVLIAIILVAAITALLLSVGDKQKLTGEWISENNYNVSYEFFEDGTFSYDSLGFSKYGTWVVFKDSNVKKIELQYNENDMPIYIKKLVNSQYNRNQLTGSEVEDAYYGNLFNMTNSYTYPIQILGFSPSGFKTSRALKTKVYVTAENYRNVVATKTITQGYYTFTGEFTDISKGWQQIGSGSVKNKEEVSLDPVIIAPGQSFGFLIISRGLNRFSRDTERMYVTNTNSEDHFLQISKGQATFQNNRRYNGKVLVEDCFKYGVNDRCVKSRGSDNWRGSVRYGLLQNIFEWNYNFESDGSIELNNNYFFKNIE